jgi:uncharacterized membrane protein YoaK (UPF0700 family)
MKRTWFAALLSLNAGFVDTAGFVGLQGLFTAHVTGNFVTLGAALVFGTKGVIAKLVALPEFIIVIALARLVGMALTARQLRTLRILLVIKVLFLLAFFMLAVSFGPFPDSDVPAGLLTGFAGIAAMAMQNAAQRVHFSDLPPTTLMTGSTTQAILDAVDLMKGVTGAQAPVIRTRFRRLLGTILCFGTGCVVAAVLYVWVGFWCLAVPVVVGTATAILRIEERS